MKTGFTYNISYKSKKDSKIISFQKHNLMPRDGLNCMLGALFFAFEKYPYIEGQDKYFNKYPNGNLWPLYLKPEYSKYYFDKTAIYKYDNENQYYSDTKDFEKLSTLYLGLIINDHTPSFEDYGADNFRKKVGEDKCNNKLKPCTSSDEKTYKNTEQPNNFRISLKAIVSGNKVFFYNVYYYYGSNFNLVPISYLFCKKLTVRGVFLSTNSLSDAGFLADSTFSQNYENLISEVMFDKPITFYKGGEIKIEPFFEFIV